MWSAQITDTEILYLLILFVFIATTSDEFFCPILAFIAKMLRMNDNLTGITLVALGNGAADVFSATTAVMHMKSNDAGLAFGALLVKCPL
ncbi:hypothetical protein GJ496_001110 [Pomphorhynchus laevis]|nr:hypothetical protein GJ496_001110 [Pomphorhynchus laevis]